MRTLSVSENYVLIWHRVQPPLQLHFEAKTKTLSRSQDLCVFSIICWYHRTCTLWCNTSFKTTNVRSSIGGAVGGLVGGFFQMKCFGIATLIIGFEDIVDEDDDLDFVEESNAQLLDNEISITVQLKGK